MLMLGMACVLSLFVLATRTMDISEDKYVMVIAQHEETRLNLYTDGVYEFSSSEGTNKVTVQDGKAWVSFADCPLQKCAQHAPISRVGEIIVCLPHQLSVEIVSTADTPVFDGIAS